jgi:hypothetical protein
MQIGRWPPGAVACILILARGWGQDSVMLMLDLAEANAMTLGTNDDASVFA